MLWPSMFQIVVACYVYTKVPACSSLQRCNFKRARYFRLRIAEPIRRFPFGQEKPTPNKEPDAKDEGSKAEDTESGGIESYREPEAKSLKFTDSGV